MQSTFNDLIESGLVKQDAHGAYEAVDSFEEHQQLRQLKIHEAEQAALLQQELSNQPSYGPADER